MNNPNEVANLPEGHSTLGSKTVFLAFIVAPFVWALLYFVVKLPPGSLLQSFSATFGGGHTQLPPNPRIWIWMLQGVLMYPVLEEIVFRGALQGWLIQRFGRKPDQTGSNANDRDSTTFVNRLAHVISLPNLLTTIAFTALHFIHQPPLWAALVFFPSLIFGWAREYSGGVLLPIMLHVWYNAGFYLLFVQL